MSGNFAIKGGEGGVGRLMANAILNFHFDFLKPSLTYTRLIGPDLVIISARSEVATVARNRTIGKLSM